MLRKSVPGNEKEMGTTEILDEDEQEELVRLLERANMQQAQFWERALAFIGLCLTSVFMCTSWLQVKAPWGRRFHAEFYTVLPPWAVTVADSLAAFAYGLASFALLQGEAARALGISGIVGLVLCVFWVLTLALVTMERTVFPVHLIWLPFGPIGFVLLVAYVRQTFKATATDIRQLRKAKFRHKKV